MHPHVSVDLWTGRLSVTGAAPSKMERRSCWFAGCTPPSPEGVVMVDALAVLAMLAVLAVTGPCDVARVLDKLAVLCPCDAARVGGLNHSYLDTIDWIDGRCTSSHYKVRATTSHQTSGDTGRGRDSTAPCINSLSSIGVACQSSGGGAPKTPIKMPSMSNGPSPAHNG